MANQANVDIDIHQPSVTTECVHQMFSGRFGRFIILAGRPIIVPSLPHLIIDPRKLAASPYVVSDSLISHFGGDGQLVCH